MVKRIDAGWRRKELEQVLKVVDALLGKVRRIEGADSELLHERVLECLIERTVKRRRVADIEYMRILVGGNGAHALEYYLVDAGGFVDDHQHFVAVESLEGVRFVG